MISQLPTLSLSGEGTAKAGYANDTKYKKLQSERLIAFRNPRRDIQCDMYGLPLRLHEIRGWKDVSRLKTFHLTQCNSVRLSSRSQRPDSHSAPHA